MITFCLNFGKFRKRIKYIIIDWLINYFVDDKYIFKFVRQFFLLESSQNHPSKSTVHRRCQLVGQLPVAREDLPHHC